ncbi:MAG: hypothetical protein JWM36_1930 [Hyphomicrobiales bacterium]|nr:hypothetical protein [Hyphomicrobiales bacterium]
MADAPTTPEPGPTDLSSSLARNINSIAERRKKDAEKSTRQERFADWVTSFAGSMAFVYVHIALYGAWIVINLGWIKGIPPFDPSFVVLAMEASVEAIFLSTFILISQNRMAATSEKRADLDLQISLLTEHELTKLTEVVIQIAERLDIHAEHSPELQDVVKDVAPERVLDEIEAHQKGDAHNQAR